MRIIQLIQNRQLRGAELFACQLAASLQRRGHTVLVVALMDGVEPLPFAGETISLNRSLAFRFLDIAGWARLAGIIRTFEPDVVQANAGDTLKYAVLSKLLFRWRAPIIFRNASTISLYISKPWVRWWNAFLFTQVAYVTSVSEASRADFLQVFPKMRNRVITIPIGIDIAPLPPAYETNTPYVLHVGGFTFEKNHRRLLHLFREIQRAVPGVELWLVGDGLLRPSIEAEAAHLQLNGVRFLGFRSDVLSLMQSARALLLPSIIEGLPGVVIEAMYCCTPVVAYDVGGISELVKNNQTGWLVPKGEEEAFVTAAVHVLRAESTEAIVANAFDLVLKQYDNQVIASRFETVYRAVVHGPDQLTV